MTPKRKARECEDCGDEMLTRRLRCKDCGKLVCNWCAGHVHRTSGASGGSHEAGKA
jgi:hypothetical protein